ncbi:hypothetical protein ACES2L_09620 [Bdellovibrio bacteriovorus]
MKTYNSKLILVAAIALLGVGCAKEGQTPASTVYQQVGGGTGTIPVSPDGVYTSDNTQYSSTNSQKTVNFTPVSLAEMNSYVGLHPLNNPSNYKLTVDLSAVENGRYSGTVKISYLDQGQQYTGTFTAGAGRNPEHKSLKDNNLLESEFNRWFIIGGKYYFSAFFQDNYGAIVLVFDNYVNQGDAQGGGIVSGRVYYKNFAQSYYYQSTYRNCWYIRSGPWNCRSDAVINKTTPYPGSGDGYRLLGTFSGLNKAAAFNQ